MPEIAVLSDRYEIDREIGAGGMARVFLALDLKYDRPVAVKILRPELASGLGRSRFLREIMIAARLSHPHVLPLFDSGEADDLLFFVMPFVEGPSLRTRLMREGTIPIGEALEITRAVAAALDYAHARDIVHRDIKPENIMMHDGVAMVTDFGIGKALTQSGGDNLTQAGVMIGTPSYMSPEQISGDPDIDGRSDIYSLACVLFEMLTGAQPFKAATPEASLSARFTKPPPDVTLLDSSIPQSVSQAIVRALSPSRDHRYERATAFAASLATRSPQLSTDPARAHVNTGPSVAVMPFTNMSSDPENEYFSDGITEEIINALMQLKHLHVAARTSSFAFKGKETNIGEIGARLNVSNVLEGSVRRAGSRVRITAQLISVADGYNIWSERYDREFDDVFEIQDEIASTIANRLEVALTEPETGSPKRPTDDMEAYQLYLRGRFLWNRRTEDGLYKSEELLQQAIDRDPGFALAHAALADTYLLLGSYLLLPRDEAYGKAKAAALRALELDESLAEAHTSLGQALRWELDWEGEEQQYKQAIRLNPNYAIAHQWFGGLLNMLGRFDDALAELRIAESLDPLSHAIGNTIAQVYFSARRFEEALTHAERALEIAPDFISAHATIAMAHARLGHADQAVAELEYLAQNLTDHPYVEMHRALVYHELGDPSYLHAYVENPPEDAEPSFVGLAYATLGDADNAFRYFDRAIETRQWGSLLHAKGNPSFDPVRSDPRFNQVLTQLGLPTD